MIQLHSFNDPHSPVPVNERDLSAVRPHESGEGSVLLFRNGGITTVTEKTSEIELPEFFEAYASLRPQDPPTFVRIGHVSWADAFGQTRAKINLRGGQYVFVSEPVQRVRDDMREWRAS